MNHALKFPLQILLAKNYPVQFLSAEPLIEKYRNGTFQEEEVAPYFMAYVILMALASAFAWGEMTAWSFASGVAYIMITIFGVLHLKKQNNESYGNGFLSKYFTLGWVITFRMLLLSVPVGVVFVGLASIAGGDDALEPAFAILTIAYTALFYWWLGELIAESNQAPS